MAKLQERPKRSEREPGTDEEIAMLNTLRRDGASRRLISLQMHRTVRAIKAKEIELRLLKLRPGWRQPLT